MQVGASSNYFELYSLPVSFSLDLKELAKRHRALIAEFHPDRFASADALSRRKSVQMATLLNEASTTLKTPLYRAGYLLQMVGENNDDENQTTSDIEFLMQQMEWREEIESLSTAGNLGQNDTVVRLESLHSEIEIQEKSLYEQFSENFEKKNYEAAKDIWLKLKFFNRLNGQLENVEEKLER